MGPIEAEEDLILADAQARARLKNAKRGRENDPVEYRAAKDDLRELRRVWRTIRDERL